jgi:2-keto-4-pentenoate hydratase/2-oxohepta-3-ene-1,7-dioic acid hydratase in catechol pathway
MKIIRYLDPEGRTRLGSLQPDGSAREIEGDLFGDFRPTSARANVKKILAPVAPVAILCIGLNYRKHAEEAKSPIPEHPVLFMKAVSAIQNPSDPLVLPRRLRSDEVDFEGELAVVIGKRCKNVGREQALDYVLGYTCANDVSARDWQRNGGGGQWCRGKTFDTFAPMGPCLVLRDEIPDPAELHLRTVLNGQAMQESGTSDMIFDVPAILSFLSASTTLLPGTVILTGTPHGVGFSRKPPVWLKAGDTVTVQIDRIGSLTNPVVDEDPC